MKMVKFTWFPEQPQSEVDVVLLVRLSIVGILLVWQSTIKLCQFFQFIKAKHVEQSFGRNIQIPPPADLSGLPTHWQLPRRTRGRGGLRRSDQVRWKGFERISRHCPILKGEERSYSTPVEEKISKIFLLLPNDIWAFCVLGYLYFGGLPI